TAGKYNTYKHPNSNEPVRILAQNDHLGSQGYNAIVRACDAVRPETHAAVSETFSKTVAVYFEDVPEIRTYVTYNPNSSPDEQSQEMAEGLNYLQSLTNQNGDSCLEEYRKVKARYQTECLVNFHYDKEKHEIIISAPDCGVLKH